MSCFLVCFFLTLYLMLNRVNYSVKVIFVPYDISMMVFRCSIFRSARHFRGETTLLFILFDTATCIF